MDAVKKDMKLFAVREQGEMKASDWLWPPLKEAVKRPSIPFNTSLQSYPQGYGWDYYYLRTFTTSGGIGSRTYFRTR